MLAHCSADLAGETPPTLDALACERTETGVRTASGRVERVAADFASLLTSALSTGKRAKVRRGSRYQCGLFVDGNSTSGAYHIHARIIPRMRYLVRADTPTLTDLPLFALVAD